MWNGRSPIAQLAERHRHDSRNHPFHTWSNAVTAKWQAEFETFTGHLSLGPDRLPVTVRIGIDATGALQFEFDTIKLTEESKFLFVSWHSATREMTYFSLDAATADGTTFSTERLFFLTLNNRSDASGTWFAPTAKCDVGLLRYRLKIPAERPALRMRLKGFRNFGSLHEECSLGRIAAQGQHEIEDVDTVTGSFTVQAVADVDATVWKKDADKLLEHIRRIMSFAAASLLGSPIIEFFAGDTLEVSVRSEARQRSGTAPIIHFLAQESIFKATVTSFFSPPVMVNHLYLAIEWFAMVATYNEVRLVNAMTALENLIDSNLSRNEALILPRNQFDKIRRVLFSIIRACVLKWAPDAAEEVLIELNEKLLDLNRRSLLHETLFPGCSHSSTMASFPSLVKLRRLVRPSRAESAAATSVKSRSTTDALAALLALVLICGRALG